ncbi:MAG TPA: glycosyl hydrolase family 28-related protein, partial [Lentisphaeria bacterium]|nr:glycosyl hydrolase family 28-related protein [Lentisphaeria bacterium]
MTKLYCILLAAMLPLAIAAQVLDFPNAGFEQGLEHWTIDENDGGMSTISDEQARSGKRSLKVVDDHTANGNWAMGPMIPCDGPAKLAINGWHYPVSGGGLGVYIRQLDQDGQRLPGDEHIRGLSGDTKQWLPFTTTVFLHETTRAVQLYFHSYSHARVSVYIDDLSLERLPYVTTPPWPPQYKINPLETHRLTAADVVGPDGIVYPDWRRCGVEGGIPDIPAAARLSDFGAKADDDRDDSVALAAACAALPADGGAIILDAGTYHFDRPVTISRDGVVIRGQGMGKTKIIFRYGIGKDGIQFYSPTANAQVGPQSRVEMHALPTGLETMTIRAGDKSLARWAVSTHSGNSFATGVGGGSILKHFPAGGPLTLEGTATYRDGTTRRCSLPIVLNPQEGETPPPNIRAAILFQGAGFTNTRSELSADGKRGDTSITVNDGSGFAAGDYIIIEGPATERWKTLTQNACRWGSYRKNALRIKAVAGNTVHLEQPLRIEFPIIDGSYIRKYHPIQRGGVEALTIEQTENLWISAVLFNNAWNCWAKDVEIIKCGRFPVYGSQAKFCEQRNVVFRDAWFKGGGGTAYAGWEHSWDCLIDGIETFAFRHA